MPFFSLCRAFSSVAAPRRYASCQNERQTHGQPEVQKSDSPPGTNRALRTSPKECNEKECGEAGGGGDRKQGESASLHAMLHTMYPIQRRPHASIQWQVPAAAPRRPIRPRSASAAGAGATAAPARFGRHHHQLAAAAETRAWLFAAFGAVPRRGEVRGATD
jgi:hypothetical protein